MLQLLHEIWKAIFQMPPGEFRVLNVLFKSDARSGEGLRKYQVPFQ